MGKKEISVLAVDLGAESGRVTAVHFDGRGLRLEELHRFPNPTVTVDGTLHWDFPYLWQEIQAGIERGKALQPASLGVDTWGLNFGLLDAQGNLLGNPVHYRDSRTGGMMEKVFKIVPCRQLFAQTGIQFMPINTLYQMMSLVESQSPLLEIADTFLTAPDLLNYWLTGAKACEFTNATTTQMFNPRAGAWAVDMLEKLNIPTHIFPEIIQPGTNLGEYEGIPVIAPACHDTGSAVAAVPAQTRRFVYISSGTWSLVGVEVADPVSNAAALAANVTNEGGVYGTYRLLKNVMGLWIVQQCRAAWKEQGSLYSYRDLVEMATAAPALACLIDPDDPIFLSPGDHPQRVRGFCQKTGQPVPESKGAVIRVVLESLAVKYHAVINTLGELSGQSVDVIHIIGGGVQNELLNQMTADVTGVPVVAGPIEATVIGNALVQLIAHGEIDDLGQARQIVGEMKELKQYEPQEKTEWQAA